MPDPDRPAHCRGAARSDLHRDRRAAVGASRPGRNTAGLIPMTFRFYEGAIGRCAVGRWPALSAFAPEIVVEVDLAAALPTMVVATSCSSASTRRDRTSAPSMRSSSTPTGCRRRTVRNRQDPARDPSEIRGASGAQCDSAEQLATTPGTIPASYNFTDRSHSNRVRRGSMRKSQPTGSSTGR